MKDNPSPMPKSSPPSLSRPGLTTVFFSLLCAALMLTGPASASNAPLLEEQFRNPPVEARPSSFWPWIGGHITREGIQADLEAMKASGMRGGIIFDLSLYIPEGDVAYASSEWWELIDFAIATGHGMGLEIGFHNCPGWATSGGPWVPVEESMKRLIFTERTINGDTPQPIQLPVPHGVREGFYRDVAVLAIPQRMAASIGEITFEDRDVSGLQKGESETPVTLRSAEAGVFLFTFDQETSVRSWAMEVVGNAAGSFHVSVESSPDGGSFAPVARFRAGEDLRGRTPLVHSFAPVRARFFRVTIEAPLHRGNPAQFRLDRLNLLPDARIANFDRISLGAPSATRHFHPPQAPSLEPAGAIDPSGILDLTDRLAPDGILQWNPPAGTWTVIRFGFTSTGATNHPAREGGKGFEVDKMDADAVRHFFHQAVTPVLERSQGKLPMIFIDSWEAGISNWTARFPEEFAQRRGYDIRTFLPVLTGRVVGSPADSHAFLQDFRLTITDLVAENYHRVMQEEAAGYDSIIHLQPYPGWNMDEFQSSRHADLIGAEFWTRDEGKQGTTMNTVRRGSGMVETMKANKRLSAESFTGVPTHAGWRLSPRTMKQVLDSAMVNGVTDFTLHSFIHQPRDDMQPGFTHGRYGTEFSRHNTWWPMAGAFMDYLARSGLLLRQGNRVADFLHMKSEGPFTGDHFPEVPSGYEYLFIAPFTVLESSAANGKVVTPGGGHHPALVLPDIWVADLALLEKLLELKQAGVSILGGPPVMPSGRRALADLAPWSDLVELLFANAPRRLTTADLEQAMRSRGLGADFSTEPGALPLEYAHRRSGDLDIYFVRNAGEEPVQAQAMFRVSSEHAQIWNPLDGSIQPAKVTVANDGNAAVELDLAPLGSVFIVFGAGKAAVEIETVDSSFTEILPQGWRVTYQPPGSEPFTREVTELTLWNQSEDDAVRHFSGIARYEGSFELPAKEAGERVVIDLGTVHDMARVRINGLEAGISWTPPDRLDITALVQAGTNRLEIEVANTWVNRLIGDEALPVEAQYDGVATNGGFKDGVLTAFPDWYRDPAKAASRQRPTFAMWKHYEKNSPLVLAGLAGPVILRVYSNSP